MLEKAKATYKNWLPVHKNMPRIEQFGLGSKIDELFLELLELMRKAIYSPVERKLTLLGEASEKIDSLRFFFQLAWEARLVSHNQFEAIGNSIEELGRMVGGWRKGLAIKTPATKAGERRE